MTISDLQKAIDATYGARDRKRGIERSFLWLVEEVGELAEAIRHGTQEEVKHEVGDVLAWLVSVANTAGVDVEEASRRFAESCPYCHHVPCSCRSEDTSKLKKSP